MPAEVVYSYTTASNQTLGLLALAGVVIFLVWFAPRDHKAPQSASRSAERPESISRSRARSPVQPADDEAEALKAKERERAVRKATAEARARADANARSEEVARELATSRDPTGTPIKGSMGMFLNSRAYDAADILDVQPPGSIRIPQVAWEFITETMAPKLHEKSDLAFERLVEEVEAPLALFHRHYANGYLDASDGTLLHEPIDKDKKACALWQHQHDLVRLAKSLFQWKLRTVVGANLGAGCLRLSLHAGASRHDVTVFLPPQCRLGSWDADWEASFAVMETILATEVYDSKKKYSLVIRPGADSVVVRGGEVHSSLPSTSDRWTRGLSDKIRDGAGTRQGLAGSFAQILTRIRPVNIIVRALPQHAYSRSSRREHALRADQLAEFIKGGRIYRDTCSSTLLMLDCGPWLPRSVESDFLLADWTWVSNMVITISGLSSEAKENVYGLLWQDDDSLFSFLASGETIICICLETASDLAMLKQGMQRFCTAHMRRADKRGDGSISQRQAQKDIRKRLEVWRMGLNFAYRNDGASVLVPEEVNFQLGPMGN